MNNSCIRVLADPAQIKDCRQALKEKDDQLLELTKFYNLAGTPARMKILFLLHREDEMCPCDLSDVLDISVAGVSQHLRKLKDGGLVKDKKVGQTIFYSLEHENMKLFMPVLEDILLKGNKEVIK